MSSDPDSLARRLMVSVTTLIVAAATLYALLTKPWQAEGSRLTADFTAASQGLTTISPVKIRGVRVGQVSRIALLPDGRVRITLRINQGVQVPTTATASLEPESIFGPKFINLIPGSGESGGPYLAARAHIATTAESADLNGLLTDADRTLAAIDPQDVAVIVRTLAQGLGGQGDQLGETIDNLDTIVAVGHRQRQRFRQFSADMARLSALRGIGASIVGIAGDTDAVIDSAAAGHDRLRNLAGQASQLSQTLAAGLDHHAAQLGEGFRSGERAAALVYQQLGMAGPFVRALIGVLPIYRAVSWMPAPSGKHLLSAKALLPSNPCELLLGVCPAGTSGGTAGTGGQ
jgi:phospholipid/cholesterol/gamma-HCH transport system substrate-binding protein